MSAALFDLSNAYLGVGIGEHLGYLSTALWTVCLSMLLPRSGVIGKLVTVTGFVIAAGILAGILEPAGVALASPVNAIAYTLWAVWLIAVGVRMIFRPADTAAVQKTKLTGPGA